MTTGRCVAFSPRNTRDAWLLNSPRGKTFSEINIGFIEGSLKRSEYRSIYRPILGQLQAKERRAQTPDDWTVTRSPWRSSSAFSRVDNDSGNRLRFESCVPRIGAARRRVLRAFAVIRKRMALPRSFQSNPSPRP